MKNLFLKPLIELSLNVVNFALTNIDEHWSKPYIDSLIAEQKINHCSSDTFKPENTISIAQFTELLLSALGYGVDKTSDHRAKQYINKARELNLIESSKDQIDTPDAAITRGMMARMVNRALNETFDDAQYCTEQIKDYQELDASSQLPVLLLYRAGIVTGYPDGSFQDGNAATHAEAAAILARLLNKDLRRVPKPLDSKTDSCSESCSSPNAIHSLNHNTMMWKDF